jgi:hypothetical protein
MARTTDQLLAQLERFVPPQLRPLRPVLAGICAMLRRGEIAADDFSLSSTIGGAEGIWLTLLARGYGVERATGESDESLRARLRNVEDKLTKTRILRRVNELLSEYTDEQAELLEHWANGFYFDNDDYFDDDLVLDQHNAFTLVCPLVGDEIPVGNDYLDSMYLDDAYLGSGEGIHPVYLAIVAEVERLRAAGVRWWLLVES